MKWAAKQWNREQENLESKEMNTRVFLGCLVQVRRSGVKSKAFDIGGNFRRHPDRDSERANDERAEKSLSKALLR